MYKFSAGTCDRKKNTNEEQIYKNKKVLFDKKNIFSFTILYD